MFLIQGAIQRRVETRFKNWLRDCGVDILPLVEPLELVRFECVYGVGIVYVKDASIYTNQSWVITAFNCYKKGRNK